MSAQEAEPYTTELRTQLEDMLARMEYDEYDGSDDDEMNLRFVASELVYSWALEMMDQDPAWALFAWTVARMTSPDGFEPLGSVAEKRLLW